MHETERNIYGKYRYKPRKEKDIKMVIIMQGSSCPHLSPPPSLISSYQCCTDCLNGNDLHLRQLSGPNLISYLPHFHLSFLGTVAPQFFLYVFPPLCQIVPRSCYSDGNLLCHFKRENSPSGFTDLTSEGSRETCATVASL